MLADLLPATPMLARTNLLCQLAVAALVGLAVAAAVAHPHTDRQPNALTHRSVPDDRVSQRVTAKLEVTAALFRGDVMLAEAADRFRELNGDDPRPMVILRAQFQGAGDEELAYRQVIQFAIGDCTATASQRAECIPALLTEFTAKFPTASPVATSPGSVVAFHP